MLAKGGRPDDSRHLIAAISALGHDAAVVSCDPVPGTDPILPDHSVRVFRVSRGPASIPAFREALESFRPDVVHFTGGPRLPAQVFWARESTRLGIPYFVSACGNLSTASFRYRWGTKKNRFYYPFAKRINHRLLDGPFLGGAAAVHAGSRNEAEIVLGEGARSVFVAPYGVKPEWLNRPRLQRAVREPVVFSYLGRLSVHHKGLDLIADAFGKVVETGYAGRFRLILAGTDEAGSLERMKRHVDALGIRDVEFPGGLWAEEKQALWDRSDYFLHVCRFNGYALSVREALGQGLPIITTRESDLGDWTYQNTMGVVVPLSAGAMAEAIIGAITQDDQVYSAMSRNARAFAEETTWGHTAEKCLAAYNKVI